METKLMVEKLLSWVGEIAQEAPGFLTPVSGGSDGAVAFWLTVQAAPSKAHAIHYGRSLRSRSWFESMGKLIVVPLPLEHIDSEAQRWAMTQTYCLSEGLWPVGSRNRTEQILGTYSRPSELATVLPLINVWKTDVMRIAEYIGVPAEIRDSSRRPDPACGRPKEISDIGLERIDTFLKVRQGIEDASMLDSFRPGEVEYLDLLLKQNEFKQHLPRRGPSF